MTAHRTANHGYTIMEAAQLSGLAESTLRYYETIGIIEPIKRDASSKHRVYSEDDINAIDAIACLSATGMSLEAMRQYLRNRGRGAAAAPEQIELLVAQKLRLRREAQAIKLRQRYLEAKIAYWNAVGAGDVVAAETISAQAKAIAAALKLATEH